MVIFHGKMLVHQRVTWSSTDFTNELKLLKPVQEFKPRSMQELDEAAMASGNDKFTPDVPPAIFSPGTSTMVPKVVTDPYVAFGQTLNQTI